MLEIEYLKLFETRELFSYHRLEERILGGTYKSPFEERQKLCKKYSWAIPTMEALQRIADLGPVVEIGAGTGYWAYLLRELGVDVLAFDIAPAGTGYYNGWHDDVAAWTEIAHGGHEKAAYYPDRTLVLCWPPYATSMAYSALKCYRGNRLIYIGEDGGGCTGDAAFHDLLHTEWNCEWFEIPSWEGIHDGMNICTRKVEL